MNSNQLQQALQFIVGTKFHTVIVTANQLNNLHLRNDKDTFIIVHISQENSNVGHWVCFHYSIVSRAAYFYDSYAFDVHDYFAKVPFSIRGQNRRPIQNEKTFNCGKFVIFFVYCRAVLKLSPNQIQNLFKNNTGMANDKKVQDFYTFLTRRMKRCAQQKNTTDLKACCMCDFKKMQTCNLTTPFTKRVLMN